MRQEPRPRSKELLGRIPRLTRAAMLAVSVLASGVPGITPQARGQTTEWGSGSITEVKPATEAERKEWYKKIGRALGDRPLHLKKTMQELLALGPTCKDDVDRSELPNMPGAEEMYKKLDDTFAKYNMYMSGVEEGFQALAAPINPKPSDGYDDWGSYYDFDPNMAPEEFDQVVKQFQDEEAEIRRSIDEIKVHPDASRLIKLLLKDAGCATS